jgi:surfeit locus 1 family protein
LQNLKYANQNQIGKKKKKKKMNRINLFLRNTSRKLFQNKKFNLTTESKPATKKTYPHGLDLRNLKPSKDQLKSKRQSGEVNLTATILFAGIPLITFGLGVWQVNRREWKINLIKMLEERTNEAPIEIPEDLNELKKAEYEYRPFKIKGRFDHSREIILTTRTDLTGSTSGTGGHVITPFQLAGRKVTVLVNRGFVPIKKFSVKTRKEGQIEDEIELVGLLRFNDTRNLFTLENKPEIYEWHSRNIDEMSKYLDTDPIFLDATSESTIKDEHRHVTIGPLGGQTMINLRNEHVTYIATWFTLSALTSYMWYRNFAKRLFKI